MKTLFFCCLTALVLSGCSPQESVQPVASATKIAGNWVLTSPASAYTLTIRIEETAAPMAGFYGIQLSGRAPINSFFTTGSFSKGPSIESGEAGTGTFQNLTTTQVGGSPEAVRFEEDYYRRIASVNRIELTSDDRLRLHHSKPAVGVLIYKRQ